jgi:hypothetical protein
MEAEVEAGGSTMSTTLVIVEVEVGVGGGERVGREGIGWSDETEDQ